MFQEIGIEDNALWEALPAAVKTKGEAFLAEMFTPAGIIAKDAEDLEDFCISDANKDGRLSWEEYKVQ